MRPQAEEFASARAGHTEHGGVVLGEDLILGPVGEHVDEIAQVPQPVGQGPDGEIPRGEWLQVPQVAVSCEKDQLVPTARRRQEEDWGCGGLGRACGDTPAFIAAPSLVLPGTEQGKRCRNVLPSKPGGELPPRLGQGRGGRA